MKMVPESTFEHKAHRKLQTVSLYSQQEKEKKRKYKQRVREVGLVSFTPLVFSTSGGMAKSTTVVYKRLASLLSQKRDQPYSLVMGWLRCHLSFFLLRSAIACILGVCSTQGHPIRNGSVALDLVVQEGQVPLTDQTPNRSTICDIALL